MRRLRPNLSSRVRGRESSSTGIVQREILGLHQPSRASVNDLLQEIAKRRQQNGFQGSAAQELILISLPLLSLLRDRFAF